MPRLTVARTGLGILLLLAPACAAPRSPANARATGAPAFVTSTIAPSGQEVFSEHTYWNGADDKPAVFLAALGGAALHPDSVVFLVRAGPGQSPDVARDVTDWDAADSLGEWFRVPTELISMSNAEIPLGQVLAQVNPESLQQWAGSLTGGPLLITRLAAETWIQGQRRRADIEIQFPE